MNEKGIAELVVIGIVAAVFAGGAITAVASDGSKPGDPLYKVDRNVEDIRAMLVYTNENRIKLELKQATERLKELKDIQASGAAKKNVETAVKNYQVAAEDYALSVDSAATKLAEIAQAGKDINQNLADTVSNTSQEQLDTLASVHSNLPDEAKDSVEKAMGSSEESIEKALDSLKGKVTEEQRQKIISQIENSKDLRSSPEERIQNALDKVMEEKQKAIAEGDGTRQQIYENVQSIIVEGQGESISSPGQPGQTSPGSTSSTPGHVVSNEETRDKLKEAMAEAEAKKQEAKAEGDAKRAEIYQQVEDTIRQAFSKFQ